MGSDSVVVCWTALKSARTGIRAWRRCGDAWFWSVIRARRCVCVGPSGVAAGELGAGAYWAGARVVGADP